MDEELIKQITQQIEAALGGNVRVEHIHVPEGSTIEDAMAKRRNDPNWCEACQEVHEDNTEREREATPDMQRKAIASLDRKIKEAKKWMEIATKLRDSIATPLDKRGPLQTLDEMLLAMQLSKMQGD